MKLIKFLLILFPMVGIAQSNEPEPKYDTVKCYVVVVEGRKDTGHLIVQKAWVVRSYAFIGYAVIIGNPTTNSPIWSSKGYPVEFLEPNKFNTLIPLKDFSPIIRDWK